MNFCFKLNRNEPMGLDQSFANIYKARILAIFITEIINKKNKINFCCMKKHYSFETCLRISLLWHCICLKFIFQNSTYYGFFFHTFAFFLILLFWPVADPKRHLFDGRGNSKILKMNDFFC